MSWQKFYTLQTALDMTLKTSILIKTRRSCKTVLHHWQGIIKLFCCLQKHHELPISKYSCILGQFTAHKNKNKKGLSLNHPDTPSSLASLSLHSLPYCLTVHCSQQLVNLWPCTVPIKVTNFNIFRGQTVKKVGHKVGKQHEHSFG